GVFELQLLAGCVAALVNDASITLTPHAARVDPCAVGEGGFVIERRPFRNAHRTCALEGKRIPILTGGPRGKVHGTGVTGPRRVGSGTARSLIEGVRRHQVRAEGTRPIRSVLVLTSHALDECQRECCEEEEGQLLAHERTLEQGSRRDVAVWRE